MKRFFAAALAAAMALPALPLHADAATLLTKRFDFGGAGVADGYIGVSAADGYTSAKGYGFANTGAVEDVSASGTGALSDAVRFNKDVPNHVFNLDLPTGVYKITVTTGDVRSTTIVAEGVPQLYFLTGSNAVDSFTIPVTDGQLNIYAGAGVGTEFSISALEIEQLSTGAVTKPTIWVGGDSTAASYYNISEDATHGWGQYLSRYVDTNRYDVRNISASGITSADLSGYLFQTAEHYGKSGDILLLAVGLNDYAKAYNAHPDAPDPTDYKANMTAMIRSAKEKGMTVYLVKQHGGKSDLAKYPLPSSMWFGQAIDELAEAEDVGVIDLYRPWLEFSLDNAYFEMQEYYTDDALHLNALGADKMAEMVSEQLFPQEEPFTCSVTYHSDTAPTAVYETEVSGKAVSNPHKGFVMTAYTPYMISDAFQYGIGGSADNHAWDVVTIVSGSPHWNDLNPENGVYNWDEIDAMLDACEEHGLTYCIRIMPYSSYLGEDYVPQWVYDAGAQKYTAPSRDDPGEQVVFPKWDDPIYLQAHKDFVRALAEKYDGDPRVELIDVRPFGDYGEWHNSFAVGEFMPSIEIQKDMLDCYADAFDKTLLVLPSNARGEIYQYALSLGITKRDDGLISIPNAEWSLRPAYRANMPVVGENYWPYAWMRDAVRKNEYSYVNWTPQRFRETIEIPHMSIFALDQDSNCSYGFYLEQKDVIDEMCNRIGYHFTVTSAARYDNKLVVRIKNTGLAPCFFNIDLCAEIMDENGKKTADLGKPIRIEKASFHDGQEKEFLFAYSGTLDKNATICLAMYDCDNPLVQGKDPTVRFDNKNTLPDNRLQLVQTDFVDGDVDLDGSFDLVDVVLLQKWLLAVPGVHLSDWNEADRNADEKLDVFDLGLMKQMLLH
ncbi:MAG: beta-galactosidase [Oscillospiraceae bacterium]|nr:beta-galactosidase [Oscillospiraceae bacterium]